MFRDQKNINIKVLSWLLLAVVFANLHYLCTFIYFDVLHINKEIFFEAGLLNIRFIWRDLFLFYDAPNDAHLDIQYYLFLVGDRIRDCIIAYLLYSAIVALSTIWYTIHQYSKIYRKIQLLTKIYLFVQIFGLINYLLCMGQFLKGVPLLIYSVSIFIIFFVRVKGYRVELKAEL